MRQIAELQEAGSAIRFGGPVSAYLPDLLAALIPQIASARLFPEAPGRPLSSAFRWFLRGRLPHLGTDENGQGGVESEHLAPNEPGNRRDFGRLGMAGHEIETRLTVFVEASAHKKE
jgi:hypothetical protein